MWDDETNKTYWGKVKFLLLDLKKNEEWIETKIEQIMIILKLSKDKY